MSSKNNFWTKFSLKKLNQEEFLLPRKKSFNLEINCSTKVRLGADFKDKLFENWKKTWKKQIWPSNLILSTHGGLGAATFIRTTCIRKTFIWKPILRRTHFQKPWNLNQSEVEKAKKSGVMFTISATICHTVTSSLRLSSSRACHKHIALVKLGKVRLRLDVIG